MIYQPDILTQNLKICYQNSKKKKLLNTNMYNCFRIKKIEIKRWARCINNNERNNLVTCILIDAECYTGACMILK